MAIENELLALAFGALSELGFEVWIRKGCGLNRCFPSVFGIVAKFPQRKCGRNSVALRLRCVIAHKTLFSQSFRRENMAIGMPYFHGENSVEFCVWCAMAHRLGFMPVYTTRANMLVPR